jgi:hypothetical protein
MHFASFNLENVLLALFIGLNIISKSVKSYVIFLALFVLLRDNEYVLIAIFIFDIFMDITIKILDTILKK